MSGHESVTVTIVADTSGFAADMARASILTQERVERALAAHDEARVEAAIRLARTWDAAFEDVLRVAVATSAALAGLGDSIRWALDGRRVRTAYRAKTRRRNRR